MEVGMITNSLYGAGMTDIEKIADWAADHDATGSRAKRAAGQSGF